MLIVALGDSTTAGTPLFNSPLEDPPDGSGDHTSQYAYWLVDMHPTWRILNRGVNGERTDEIAARFDRDVLDRRPHAVVIIAGVNDVYQGRSADAVIKQLRSLYNRAGAERIPVLAGSILPFNTATAAQNRAMHEINAWIEAEAGRDPNLWFVDTRAAVAAADDPDRLASSADDQHPDIDGYRKMARVIGPALERLKVEAEAAAEAAGPSGPNGPSSGPPRAEPSGPPRAKSSGPSRATSSGPSRAKPSAPSRAKSSGPPRAKSSGPSRAKSSGPSRAKSSGPSRSGTRKTGR
ncbi:MAG: GDSL-type esterase/lipase family protein [Vicinamibacterales bacterium]